MMAVVVAAVVVVIVLVIYSFIGSPEGRRREVIMDNLKETRKSVSLPALGIGYIWGVLIIVCVIAVVGLLPEDVSEETTRMFDSIFSLFFLLGFIYWLVCVHRIHKVLLEATDATYPIKPRRVVWFHLLPIYNVYWIFKWPQEVAKFININAKDKKMSPYTPGILIFTAFLIVNLSAAFGYGIGIILLFVALKGMVRNIKEVLAKDNIPAG